MVPSLFADFAVVGLHTNSYQAHRAILDVAMVVSVRKGHFLAIDPDFVLDRVHVLDYLVATFGLSPLFVFMHTTILCLCTEIYKAIRCAVHGELK